MHKEETISPELLEQTLDRLCEFFDSIIENAQRKEGFFVLGFFTDENNDTRSFSAGFTTTSMIADFINQYVEMNPEVLAKLIDQKRENLKDLIESLRLASQKPPSEELH